MIKVNNNMYHAWLFLSQMAIVCTIYAGGESTNFLIKLPYVNGMLYNLYACHGTMVANSELRYYLASQQICRWELYIYYICKAQVLPIYMGPLIEVLVVWASIAASICWILWYRQHCSPFLFNSIQVIFFTHLIVIGLLIFVSLTTRYTVYPPKVQASTLHD